MANLEIVKQESKSNLLPSEPLPHLEQKIGKCPWPIERGEKAGQPCNHKTFDGNELCEAHLVIASNRKSKNEPMREVNVEAKASNPSLPVINAVLPPAPIVLPAPSAPIDEILVIMRNFSIAMVNLTELLKRH